MFARIARVARPATAVALRMPNAAAVPVRCFSAAPSDDVVIPVLVDTLEWVLASPPNVHQFEEAPIIVEIEHLDNLIIDEDH